MAKSNRNIIIYKTNDDRTADLKEFMKVLFEALYSLSQTTQSE